MSGAKKTNKIYLREDETTVLQSFLQEWSDKPDKKSRDAFVSGTVVPEIQALNGKDYGPDIISTNKVAKGGWEKRVNAVNTWFKNHKPFKDRQVFKLERKIPLRRVVGKEKAADIDKIIASQHPDLHKGDKTYPGIYQKAITEYMRKMSDEETQEMEELREEWKSEGPPLDVRLKAAKKYGRKAIVNAHQLLDKEMYISCLTLSMFPDPDTGTMGVTCHDYISEIHATNHGKKFKSFRDWSGPKYGAFMELIINYANYVKEQRNEDPVDEEATASPVLFVAGPGDLPLLPAPVNGVRSTETARHAKDVIRAYFLRHYQLATGSESARTPWATIGETPEQFFDLACLPDGFKLQDPSRLGVNVKKLLLHLRERQEQHGVLAFHFHHVLRNNVLEPAHYPNAAQSVLDSKDPLNQAKVKVGNDESKVEAVADAPIVQTEPIPISSTEKQDHDTVESLVNNRIGPAEHSIPVAPPGWSQFPSPNYWHPHFLSNTNSHPIPSHPLMYHPQMMAPWIGQPGWGPPNGLTPGPSAVPSLLMSKNPIHPGWGLPASPPAPLSQQPVPPLAPPSGPSAFSPLPMSEHPIHPLHPSANSATAVGPVLPSPAPPHPSAQFNDPHPIPSGEPPFSCMYPAISVDQRHIDQGSVRTPTKKPLSKTPRKTPGKRKREEAEEDTPTKPTRASHRIRTPKKIFDP